MVSLINLIRFFFSCNFHIIVINTSNNNMFSAHKRKERTGSVGTGYGFEKP